MCVTLGVTGSFSIVFRISCFSAVALLQFTAGGSSPLMSLLPTKLLMSWEDIGADHSDVPAMFVMFSSCGSHFL